MLFVDVRAPDEASYGELLDVPDGPITLGTKPDKLIEDAAKVLDL